MAADPSRGENGMNWTISFQVNRADGSNKDEIALKAAQQFIEFVQASRRLGEEDLHGNAAASRLCRTQRANTTRTDVRRSSRHVKRSHGRAAQMRTGMTRPSVRIAAFHTADGCTDATVLHIVYTGSRRKSFSHGLAA